MKICVFGGTFDPVHLGHEEIVAAVRRQLKADLIFIVPNSYPPHKRTYASALDRYRMAVLAFEGMAFVKVSPAEMDDNALPQYTDRTIERMKTCFPGAEIIFIVGSDSIAEMGGWRGGYSLLSLARFVVIERPNSNLSKLDKNIRKRTSVLEGQNPISSTMIREKISVVEDFSSYLNNRVYRYIKLHSLYSRSK